MATVLDDFAESVAATSIGVTPEALRNGITTGKPVVGFDPIALMAFIEAIMAAISKIIGNCPQNNVAVRESIKKPTRWQRAQSLGVVRDYVGDCFGFFWRRKAARVAELMFSQAAELSDDVIDSAIVQVRNNSL